MFTNDLFDLTDAKLLEAEKSAETCGYYAISPKEEFIGELQCEFHTGAKLVDEAPSTSCRNEEFQISRHHKSN